MDKIIRTSSIEIRKDYEKNVFHITAKANKQSKKDNFGVKLKKIILVLLGKDIQQDITFTMDEYEMNKFVKSFSEFVKVENIEMVGHIFPYQL